VRSIPDELDRGVVTRIDDRLAGVEADHRVVIGWAVESGSRAWGFPSPDSDYDCRFLYVHPVDAYLSPWLPRDVIETPLDSVYDVNGWDLRKAVDLMVRGNATITEWLRSPIVYRGEPAFRDLLLDLADRVAEPALIARHYAHVGRLQWDRLGAGDLDAPVRLKGVFYCLRPAAALRWMRAHPDESVPPMRLQTLLEESEAPADVLTAVSELVAVKARTRELGAAVFPPPLRAFVLAELTAPDLVGAADRRHDPKRSRMIAADTFRAAVTRFNGLPGATPRHR
jgi:predicted nucleotidyltransferase